MFDLDLDESGREVVHRILCSMWQLEAPAVWKKFSPVILIRMKNCISSCTTLPTHTILSTLDRLLLVSLIFFHLHYGHALSIFIIAPSREPLPIQSHIIRGHHSRGYLGLPVRSP